MSNYNKRLKIAAERLRLDTHEIDSLIESVLGLARLVRSFSQIHRSVPLDRKGTPESDTDHTVLLALLACCIAAKYASNLDIGKVAQYALVHDLVEAYSGDTNTTDYGNVNINERKNREKEAHQTLVKNHSAMPWLIETLDLYEKLSDSEARFVKALDKAMPAVNHNLSDGLIFEQGQPDYRTPAQWEEESEGNDKWLREREWSADQELALSIRELLTERLLDRHWEKYPNS